MVVVVIVLVIILQNEPITTDTITILTRHFIILTRKKKYGRRILRDQLDELAQSFESAFLKKEAVLVGDF